MSLITPSIANVGAIMRSRTRSDASGDEIGTFDATTRPKGTEVAEFIEQAEDLVAPALPDDLTDLPEKIRKFAKRVIAIRAAMFVELSLYQDRTVDTDDVYVRLSEMFNGEWQRLSGLLGDIGEDTPDDARAVVVTLSSPYSGDRESVDDTLSELLD